LAVRTPVSASELNSRLLEHDIVGGYDLGRAYPGLENALLLCCTELTTPTHIERLANEVRAIVAQGALVD